jgi:hypothetical protein
MLISPYPTEISAPGRLLSNLIPALNKYRVSGYPTPATAYIPDEPLLVLYGELMDGWASIQPIPLHAESDIDGYIVSDDLFAVYGTGPTLSIATNDYIHSLIEYYELVSERISDDQANNRLIAYLSKYLHRKDSDNANDNQAVATSSSTQV